MTKVSILGKAEAVKPELKRIEFVKKLNALMEIVDIQSSQMPRFWENILLLHTNYCKGYDLMFANNENGQRILVLGHFNDGVV